MPPSDKRYRAGALLPRLGPLLKRRREKLRLTGDEVALHCGISTPALYNIEGGRYLPSIAVYTHLCRILKLKPGPLLSDRLQYTRDER